MQLKRFRTAVVLCAVVGFSTGALTSSAPAANIPVAVKSMTLISHVGSTDTPRGLLVRHKNIYLFGTIVGFVSTDGYLQAIDENGAEKWKLPLDSGGNDIATAGVVDQVGNIWIAGTSSLPISEPSASPSPSSTVLNPDSVTVDEVIELRQDPTVICLWKVSPAGNLLASYQVDVKRASLVKGIAITSTTVSIVGTTSTAIGSAGFLIRSTVDGVFGKQYLIGKSDTEINGIVKRGKSLLLLGSSSEKLFSQPVAGIRDGIIATFSSTGNYVSLVRSFNSASARSWKSGTLNGFLGGLSTTGEKIEAVVTKYSEKLLPTWTTRFAAASAAYVIDPTSTIHIALFTSTQPIGGVKGWKPLKGALIALYLDKNGEITGAFRAPAMAEVIAAGFSQELGLVALTKGQFGVSIFHALSR